MILAECVVVGALVAVSWQLLGGHQSAPAVAVLSPQPSDVATSPSPAAAIKLQLPARPAHRQVPGLNVDTAFWGLRLGELNKDEAALEAIEWQLTHAAQEAAHHYLESVVLPAIHHAEEK